MRTPELFDYDLWTTEECGAKHYWVRVKSTGEVAEVDEDVMKVLRREEKRMRREMTAQMENGTVLCLDYADEDDTSEKWLTDPCDFGDDFMFQIMEKDFVKLLTDNQKKVYWYCVINNYIPTECARELRVSRQSVDKVMKQIREKAKKYFF